MPFGLFSIYGFQRTQNTHISRIEMDRKWIHSDKGKDSFPYLGRNQKDSNDLAGLLRLDHAKHMKTKTWHIQILNHLDGRRERIADSRTTDWLICHSPEKGWQANRIIGQSTPPTTRLFDATYMCPSHPQGSLCCPRKGISFHGSEGRILSFVSELSSFGEHSSTASVFGQQRDSWYKCLCFCYPTN